MSPTPLSATARAYLWGVALTGFAVIAGSALELARFPIPPQAALLGLLAGLSGAAALRMRAVSATFSIGDAFSFAALFLYGPAAATLTAMLDTLGMSLRINHSRREAPRLIFNVAASSLAMWLAGHATFAVVLTQASGIPERVGPLLGVLIVPATLFFLLETGMVAIAVAMESREPPFVVWRRHFLGLWTGPFSGAYAGALLALYARNIAASLLIFLLPIPLILYFTFRSWLRRIDADLRHLAEMQRAYESMTQAFATAIDAKDQVTHGHLRRVQTYALALARAVGVTDGKQLKALEAAALLHDVGKIGTPERILNKPGPLTAAEYAEMKEHVTIGTDILSNIEFPYPVVPIVKHHHESWDGTGYPDRLQGEEIPLGARILMVVDCFDALTSDRPYRGRMSATDAFRIILERRGNMYDPLVVDTFVRIQPQIAIPENLLMPDTRTPHLLVASLQPTLGS